MNLSKLKIWLGTCAVISVMIAPATQAKTCTLDDPTMPATYIWDAQDLAAAKARLNTDDGELRPAYSALLSEADAALTQGPWSVVDKTKTPPSGDKQDYYSIGPYWWPNAKSEDGLPYIRRDGEVNPERREGAFDNSSMGDMSKAVEALSLAGYFSGDARYSARAATVLRHWFVNPATRMNPNLNHAQAIPGRNDGRGIGIIDTYRLVPVVDAIGLLAAEGHLSAEDMTALKDWFAQYAVWMLTSENGQKERLELNNHGTYYDAQLALFAGFAGDAGAIDKIIDGVERRRIPGQIDKKGRMPRELTRTRPFHYTAYNNQAFIDLAEMADCAGRDLWTYETKKGTGMKTALDFQTDYLGKLSSWKYKELRKIKPVGAMRNACRVRAVYDDARYDRAAKKLMRDYPEDRMILLTNGCAVK